MKNKDALTKEDKKMLNSIFLRSLLFLQDVLVDRYVSMQQDLSIVYYRLLIVTIKMILKGVVKRWSDIRCFITLLKI